MSEVFWSSVAVPLLAGGAATFLVEQLLNPAPGLRARPWRAFAAHIGVWIAAFTILLAVCQRPWFAALLALSEQLFLALISNAKVRALREPFVFADFEYLTDTLKHPRLYMPYLGIGRAVTACLAFGLAMYLGFTIEPSLAARSGTAAFLLGTGALGAVGLLVLRIATPATLPATFRAMEDKIRLGQLASLWYYAVAEFGRYQPPAPAHFSGPGVVRTGRELPHIVAIQSESFFDARRVYPGIRPELLRHFDAIRARAAQHGCVHVPAWGGNTARTEFSFLTGLAADSLGVHRFSPHRRLSRRGLPSLASYLKAAGYRTVCIHPYPASFYSRHLAYPGLGFDEFIDLRAFEGAERFGPYISDGAVTDKICELLDTADSPLLLFAITMENHGPLHLESVDAGDVERLYTIAPPDGYEDLTVYLRHLANADTMVHRLRQHLERSSRDAWLCWYGDHVPILPKVYEATGFRDGRTEYFVWNRSAPPGVRPAIDIGIEKLATTLIAQAGLTAPA